MPRPPQLLFFILLIAACGNSASQTTENMTTSQESSSSTDSDSETTAAPTVSEVCEQACDYLETCLDNYSAFDCKVNWDSSVNSDLATENCATFTDDLCACFNATSCDALADDLICESEAYRFTAACENVCIGRSLLDSEAPGACSTELWCPVGTITVSCDGEMCSCTLEGEPSGGCEQVNACDQVNPEDQFDSAAMLEFAQSCCEIPVLPSLKTETSSELRK